MMDQFVPEPCRVCQKVSDISYMHYLLNLELKDKFEIICGVEVKEEDELIFVCEDCKKTIDSSYNLRQLARREASSQQNNKVQDLTIKTENASDDSENDFKTFLHAEIVCNDCNNSFPSHEELEDHLNDCDASTNIPGQTKCKKCWKNVKTIYLNDHLTKCRGKKAKHKCSFRGCGKNFVRKISLNTHVNATHYDKKQFQCDICKKRYSTKDVLRSHMFSHMSERKQQCFICGAKFKTRLSLYKHKARHSGVFFHCNYCVCRFKDKYERDYHERIKHLGQKVNKKVVNQLFPCPECGFEYKMKSTLNRHIIRNHKNVKDYICMACPAKYGFHNSLKIHILRKHPEINLDGITLLPDPHAEMKKLEEDSELIKVEELNE